MNVWNPFNYIFYADPTVFISTLVRTNIAQLEEIFSEYRYYAGHDIEQAIDKLFYGEIKDGLLVIGKRLKI